MTNAIELQIISRILTSNNPSEIDRLCAYDDSYYAVFKDQINFILKHREKYGEIPDLFTFQAEFNNVTIIDVNEPLNFLEDELKKNKQHILFLETFNKLADLNNADVTDAWEYLSQQCEKAAQLDASNPMDIIKDAEKRADQIIEFNQQNRIPTGFPEVDKLMYGGLSTVEELLVIIARTNTGKAQPLWSKVLTPQGWKTMGEVKVGDILVGKNNDNGKVVQIFPQGVKDYYRVHFDDGTYAECCDDHLWEVLDGKRRERDNRHFGEHLVLTTRELRSSLSSNYSVDISEAVEFNSEFNPDSELDGYLLGVILGDGGLRDGCVRITNENEELWSRIDGILSNYNCIRSGKLKDYIRGKVYGDNFVLQKIKQYGLIDVKSVDKFIPKQFLSAPISVRRALLSGLVDTDGYISKDNKQVWEFDTASEQLAEDFAELARSLGVKVKVHDRVKSSYTKDGKRISGSGFRHLVCRSEFNPFFISVKANKYHMRTTPLKHSMPKRHCKMIRSIEYVGKTECQCILLDNISHTYITDNYTVTHNTWVTTKIMESAQKNGFPVLYYSPEMRASFVGTRFDTWRGHFKNSEIFRGQYSEEYKEYIKNLTKDDASAFVVEDSDISGGRMTVRVLENLVKKHHIKLLVIDGLSYIADTSATDNNSSLKYKNICNDLFRLSKTHQCAVVCSVQANRETKENKDDKGEPFPTMFNAAESDHPARIATQVFALRQLFDSNTLEIRLEKSRIAKNTKPVLSYVWDPNTGSTEFVADNKPDSPVTPTSPTVSVPQVTTKIVQRGPTELIDDDDDDDEDIEF